MSCPHIYECGHPACPGTAKPHISDRCPRHSNGTIRVDYRREGRDALGFMALAYAPIAFLSPADRDWIMGCDDYTGRDQMPPAVSLRDAGTEIMANAAAAYAMRNPGVTSRHALNYASDTLHTDCDRAIERLAWHGQLAALGAGGAL